MEKHRIYTMAFAGVYPHYVTKAEKKGRTKAEVDEVIRWLTGYTAEQLAAQIMRRRTSRPSSTTPLGCIPTPARLPA